MKKIAFLISLILLQVSVSFAQPATVDTVGSIYASVKMLLIAKDSLDNDLASSYDADTALANIKAGSDTVKLKVAADNATRRYMQTALQLSNGPALFLP